MGSRNPSLFVLLPSDFIPRSTKAYRSKKGLLYGCGGLFLLPTSPRDERGFLSLESCLDLDRQ